MPIATTPILTITKGITFSKTLALLNKSRQVLDLNGFGFNFWVAQKNQLILDSARGDVKLSVGVLNDPSGLYSGNGLIMRIDASVTRLLTAQVNRGALYIIHPLNGYEGEAKIELISNFTVQVFEGKPI